MFVLSGSWLALVRLFIRKLHEPGLSSSEGLLVSLPDFLLKVIVLVRQVIICWTFCVFNYPEEVFVPPLTLECSCVRSGGYFYFKGVIFNAVSLRTNIWIKLACNNKFWSFALRSEKLMNYLSDTFELFKLFLMFVTAWSNRTPDF